VTGLCKSPVSYDSLQPVATHPKNPELLKQHCFDKTCVYQSILISILAIDRPSEEASVSYPECIL